MHEQTMKRLTDRVLYLPHRRDTDRPVLAAVTGTERTLYMDAGNSPAHATLFLRELERFGVPKADLMLLTHAHWDHIFGLKRFGLPVLAHTETRRAMAAMLLDRTCRRRSCGRFLRAVHRLVHQRLLPIEPRSGALKNRKTFQYP